MKSKINNEFYNDLNDEWYHSNNHAIALLRAEQKVKNQWVKDQIQSLLPDTQSILDIACGGGFLANELAKYYSDVHGVDASETSLETAKKFDQTKKVQYQYADAYNLPFENETFDVVCLMDFLEHVERPEEIILEASRVLKPKGLMFYHTFNRNFLSKLIVIKAVEAFVPNTPKNLHVYELFLKPKEVWNFLRNAGLKPTLSTGIKPKFDRAFFKSIMTRRLDERFDFELIPSHKLAYLGVAKKC